MIIGAQMYTVNEHCKNLEDLSESLKKIADIGYKTVQVSGVCQYEPEWMNEQLANNGLECVLTHMGKPELFINEIDKVVNHHKVMDCKYVGLGCYSFDECEEKYQQFVTDFKPVTKTLKENGMYFMYHNHAGEFYKFKDSGKIILERLFDDFSADELGFTLDVCWAQTGGGDPAYWLEFLKGRVPCIHVKDRNHKAEFTVLGEGNMNMDRILKSADKAGCDYLLVEQDNCYGEDPFDCLKRSYEFLKSRGFE